MDESNIGDFSCNKGNYWADWYFGRWKHSYDSCSCNNGVEHCYTGSTNNCTTATNWGNTSVSYNK